MADNKIKVGITQGDINGIGYEVIIKTLMEPHIAELCTPVVYGSPKVAAFYRKVVNAENFNFNIIRTAEEANPKRANIINVMDDEVKVDIGKSTDVAGKGALAALKAAVQDLKDGKIQALVTAPFNKENVQSSEYHFPGHTEFLAETFGAKEAIMLLVSDRLRVGVATGHIPLSKVAQTLSKDLILRKLKQLNNTLKEDFQIRRPRIAVLGLNPHSGDGGLLGEEEKNIIIPAVEEAIKGGLLAFGPYAADGFFGSNNVLKFDAVLAMYHDQGLAPFKTMAFESGVNYTGGLSIIRTSPAHGTAYDIAGKDTASPDSFRAALYMACDAYKNRKEYAELTKNPLPLSKTDNEQRTTHNG
ncbi:MAG: 4-hydroxythreonine-4-phosphate dehydrogenase PdxA [Prevotellaceae bacterium]|jgi:4-hydroxythreonine-4-phosphate dehydrogenase|nr:4-hydroxythreonine-4-phosphate dehydrogenase PdxA [Prevotellaceae bacterium]